ncbi:MAG: transcription termination/antitermination NusG family protein [Deltaproteobacteria bacterium]|nr:transcription termination/antitermination NusG family protein [Deltaproteobacteria bacterium]
MSEKKRWFIIKTKPQKDENVTSMVAKAGFEVFCPKIREIFYAKNVASFRTKPLFPSYLFLHVDFDDPANVHMIKYTRGVSRILCAEGKPLPLAEQIVATIKARTNAQGIIERRQTVLKAGDPIRVRKGLLKDLIGILEKPASQEERVIVLLKLANYEMKAQLHWTEVEKLHAA